MRGIAEDERGAAAVEAAMFAPVLALCIVAGIGLGFVGLERGKLDRAAATAATTWLDRAATDGLGTPLPVRAGGREVCSALVGRQDNEAVLLAVTPGCPAQAPSPDLDEDQAELVVTATGPVSPFLRGWGTASYRVVIRRG